MIPTIIIFLKAPVAGQVKTRLAAGVGKEEATEIYQRLAERQMQAMPKDWPVEIHHDPAEAESLMKTWLGVRSNWSFHPQIDAALGERLQHAAAGALRRQAEAVLLIGGDCPGLGAAELQAAASMLSDHTVVMGPAIDGGYYLIGMRRLHRALFDDVPWGTGGVADRTRVIIKEHGWTLGELPPLRDVDTLEDWRALQDLVE